MTPTVLFSGSRQPLWPQVKARALKDTALVKKGLKKPLEYATNPVVQKRAQAGALSALFSLLSMTKPAQASTVLLTPSTPSGVAKQPVTLLNNIPTNADGTLNIPPETLVLKLLEKNRGVGLGEYHTDLYNKDFVTKNMAAFAKAGVKVIFLEYFRPEDNPLLDAYGRRGDAAAYAALQVINRDRVEKLLPMYRNAGGPASVTSTNPETLAKSLMEMIKAAQKHGIQVRGLTDPRDMGTAIKIAQEKSAKNPNQPPVPPILEYLQIANAAWQKKIDAYLNQLPPDSPNKFLMVTGAAHNVSFPRSPGIDNRTQVPAVVFLPVKATPEGENGVRVRSVPAGQEFCPDPESLLGAGCFGADYEFRRAPGIPNKA